MFSLHKISVLYILFILSLPATAGNPYRFNGGGAEAGAGYACAGKQDFWSSFHNEAILGLNRSFSAGICYENRFSLNELSARSAAVIIPAGRASMGGLFTDSGFEGLRRHAVSLACGLPLSDKISSGVGLDYFIERCPSGYNDRMFITFGAGILVSASEKVRIGIHIFNPLPGPIRKKYLPMTLKTGVAFIPDSGFYAGLEAEMSTGRSLVIKTGFEYGVSEKVWIRGGFRTENSSFSFGMGYRLKSLKLDAGFLTHDKLGITSSVSMIFSLKQ